MKLVHVFSAPQSAYFFMRGQLDYMYKKGIHITVIMPFDTEFTQKFKQRESNVNVINIDLVRSISLGSDFFCLFKLINIFRTLKPDIIHLHTPKASFLGAIAGRVLFKRNIIYQMHGLISIQGNNVQKGLMYQIEKITCFLSTKIFAVSNSLRQFAIENNYCNSEKISVIQNGTINGIDYLNQFNPDNIFKNNEKLNQITSNKFVIGFVGRLMEDKGIADYVQVLAVLKKNKIPIIGIIVGPDESGSEFKSLLEYHNLISNVDLIVLGQQLNPERFMIYFDVLLLPTKREGFGLVAAEVNAMQIPVIGYDIPGLRDAVISEETGILVDYGNREKLVEATLRYYNDPKLKHLHGHQGRVRVINEFNSEDIWSALYKEYENLMKT